MKNNMVVLTLSLVLMVLVGLFLGREYMDKQPQPTGYESYVIDLHPENIGYLLLQKGEQQLEFIKTDGDWQVNGEKADSLAVDAFIDSILQPNSVDVVAETQNRYEEFGLNEAEGVRMVMQSKQDDATQKLELRLGKTTSDGRYVRFLDKNTVYLVYGVPHNSQSMDVNSWIEKITSPTPTAIPSE